MNGISYFNPVEKDESLYYLGQIFGKMTESGLLPGDGTVSILGVMFDTFNEIILGVGALIVIYITVMGVMMSAHEGEFMKKWNSLWVPIRAVFGIAALFPTATGYSALQLIMMWVIIQGVGAADTLWSTALSYAEIMGSVTAQVNPSTAGIKSTMNSLFRAITCEETAKINARLPVDTENDVGSYYCYQNVPGWCKTAAIGALNDILSQIPGITAVGLNTMPTNGVKTFGPENGACGKLYFCNQDEKCAPLTSEEQQKLKQADKDRKAKACAVCKAQAATLTTIVKNLRELATFYVNRDLDYLTYFYKGQYIDWKGSQEVDDKYPQPGFVKDYCQANNISDKDCHGTMRFDFREEKDIETGKKQISANDRLERAKNRGSLPDARVGFDSPSLGAVSDVIWPFAMKKYHGINPIDAVLAEYLKMIDDNLSKDPSQKSTLTTKGIVKQIKATKPTGALLEAQQKGWIAAGGYYYFLIRDTGKKLQDSSPPLEMLAVHPSAASEDSGIPPTMKTFRNNYSASAALASIMAGDKPGNYGGANTGALDDGMGAVNGMMQSSMNNDTGINPLIQLASAGYDLLTAAQVIFASFMVITFLLGMISGINFFVLGTGTTNPMAVAYPVLMMWVMPILFGLLGMMVTIGATLCVYIPLIPYIIFTTGAIGWMISTIEAMVAGPLVALGILAPGGHSEVLGKAEPALLLLFNIFLRPSLMVFGLIASMLLSCVVVKMVNSAFWPLVYPQISSMARTSGKAIESAGTSVHSPLVVLFFLSAYVALLVAVLNKSFAAIYIIPERVMRWIGGQGDQYGEAEALGGVKQAVDSEAGGAAQGMKSGLSGAESKGERTGGEQAKGIAARKEKADASKPGATPTSGSGSGGSVGSN